MLTQFEKAERIRQMFFTPGAKNPELNFIVRTSNLDAAATRFYVNIDGQVAAITPGAETRIPMSWPGPDKRTLAVAYFEDKTAAPEQAKGFEGPWALFQLMDAARTPFAPAQPDADLDSTMRFQTAFHKAQVTIEAANATSNPFGFRDWRQFNCEH
jgi:type VI secretion system protein ImpL